MEAAALIHDFVHGCCAHIAECPLYYSTSSDTAPAGLHQECSCVTLCGPLCDSDAHDIPLGESFPAHRKEKLI